MKNVFKLFIKKSICILLAAVMMLNFTGETFAQVITIKQLTDRKNSNIQANFELRKKEIEKRTMDTPYGAQAIERESKLNDFALNTYERQLNSDSFFRRAEEIKYMLTKDVSREDVEEGKPLSKEEFFELYEGKVAEESNELYYAVKSNMDKNYKDLKAQLNEYKEQGYSEEVLSKWYEESDKDLKFFNEQLRAEVEKNKRQALASKVKRYEEYLKESKANEAEHNREIFYFIKGLAAEMLEMNKQNPHMMANYLIELSPMMLTLRNGKEEIFTKDDKEVLALIYIKQLNDKNSLCRTYAKCAPEINAMTGLGILDKEDIYYGETAAITEFLHENIQNPEIVMLMNTGVAALLNMKQHDRVDAFLSSLTVAEKKDDSDVLTLAHPVRSLTNIRGQYLGGVSTYTRYKYKAAKDDKTLSVKSGSDASGWYTRTGNALTDIAIMLAEDGSKESLAILKRHGIEQCKVNPGMSEGTYQISCSGIIPFLVGALLSGKSGAEKYMQTAEISPAAKKFLESTGRINYNGQKDYTQMLIENMDKYAAQKSFTREELIANHIVKMGMGDLSTAEEKELDETLVFHFGKHIDTGSKFIVADDRRIEKKAGRQSRSKVFADFAQLADFGVTIWSFWWMGGLVVKGAVGGSRIALGGYRGMKLAKMGGQSERTLYMLKHKSFYAGQAARAKKRAATVKKVTDRITNGMGPSVRSQLAQYSSTPMPVESIHLTPKNYAIKNLLADATFNAADGKVVLNNYEALQNSKKTIDSGKQVARKAKKHGDNINKLFEKAVDQAHYDYAMRPLGQKFTSFKSILKRNIDDVFKNTIYYDDIMAYGMPKFDYSSGKTLAFLKNESEILKSVTAKFDNVVPGVNSSVFSYIPMLNKTPWVKNRQARKALELKKVLYKKGKLQFVKSNNEGIDPDMLKIKLGDDSMSNIFRFGSKLKLTAENPMNLKLSADYNNIFHRIKNSTANFFRGKPHQFKSKLKVKVDGKEAPGLMVEAEGRFADYIVDVRGGKVSLINPDKGKRFNGKFDFTLPKSQIENFIQIAENMQAAGNTSKLTVSFMGSKNKVAPLFFTSAISLSSASTGLVNSLPRYFGSDEEYSNGISSLEASSIGLIIPYAGYLLAPVVSPMVKRFGAPAVLKASSITAVAALAAPMIPGYTGFNDIHPGNEENPPIWPLYISSGLVGLSAAMTKSTVNPLLKAVGGGGKFLQSMVFKNVSGFALLIPPLVANSFGGERGITEKGMPVYYDNLDKDGNKVQKTRPFADFSLSYPVLGALTLGSLAFLQRAQLPKVGKIKDFGKFDSNGAVTTLTKAIKKDMAFAGRAMIHKENLPIIIPSFLFVGAEAAYINKYANKGFGRYWDTKYPKDELGRDPYKDKKALYSMISIFSTPIIIRAYSPKILNALGGDKLTAYHKMMAISLGSALLGGGLMLATPSAADEEDPAASSIARNVVPFAIGAGLVAGGFANTTQSIQKIGNFNLMKKVQMAEGLKFGKETLKTSKDLESLVTSFDVVFPVAQTGMAVVPLLSEMGASKIKEVNPNIDSSDADRYSMSIPLASLGIGAGIYLKKFAKGTDGVFSSLKNSKSIFKGFKLGEVFTNVKTSGAKYIDKNFINPYKPAVPYAKLPALKDLAPEVVLVPYTLSKGEDVLKWNSAASYGFEQADYYKNFLESVRTKPAGDYNPEFKYKFDRMLKSYKALDIKPFTTAAPQKYDINALSAQEDNAETIAEAEEILK
ncbi:hypothetical protein Dip518_000401 [Parelusimicrobium proximum]|uniref:hypothetical protein n=1 Tax=Parelusimicrobium proximum TaxID=3228953 RepID=UPI003D17B43C